MDAALITGLVLVLFVVITILRSVRIVPQGRARNVERLGRYHRTLQPGMNFVVPFVDRVCPVMELREQVVSFPPQPVITEDNLVVEIDTVLYFQVTDPRSAAYEIANYLRAVEQLTVTTLRNVVGSMDLEGFNAHAAAIDTCAVRNWANARPRTRRPGRLVPPTPFLG
jgi:regulator of protease activity HflC (stomatin/prohibitin superfamily)